MDADFFLCYVLIQTNHTTIMSEKKQTKYIHLPEFSDGTKKIYNSMNNIENKLRKPGFSIFVNVFYLEHKLSRRSVTNRKLTFIQFYDSIRSGVTSSKNNLNVRFPTHPESQPTRSLNPPGVPTHPSAPY